MHTEAFEWLRANRPPGPQRVLDLGSWVNGMDVRDLFPDAEKYHGVDCHPGTGVDEVREITSRAVGWFGYTTVVCAEVLEHASEWQAILTVARNALNRGGTLLVTAAGEGREPHSCIRQGPPLPGEWYENIDHELLGICLVTLGFTDVHGERDHVHHDVYAKAVRP